MDGSATGPGPAGSDLAADLDRVGARGGGLGGNAVWAAWSEMEGGGGGWNGAPDNGELRLTDPDPGVTPSLGPWAKEAGLTRLGAVEGREAESSPTDGARAIAGVGPEPGEVVRGITLLPSKAFVVMAKLPVILLTASSTCALVTGALVFKCVEVGDC
jgi:hypothetical protein